MTKSYRDFNSVEELMEYYKLESKNIITEEENQNDKGNVVKTDSIEVHYDESKGEYNNIFKHIIVFTNSKDPDDNKTLKNIIDAIEDLKKHNCPIIPKLHLFIAAEIDSTDDESEMTITDGDETFTINKESNLDTLIFSRLSVQDEDNCEHVVQLLQDRGFLVLNPVKYSALACNKYESAVLFQKGDIPQPNFSLMTKDMLYDEKIYNDSMKSIYKEWNPKDSDKNKDLKFVVKILDGHGGTGVAMIDGKSIYAILQMIFAIDPERQLILQKKEEADGGDIRVHVLTLRDKQIILAAMKRIKINNDFRSNVSLGATAEEVKLTPEQEQIALRVATLSKMPWCAVDIMPLVKGSNPELGDNVVLEMNASPGTAGITEVIGRNFINVLLNNLSDPSQFMLQDKVAGYMESVTIKFTNDVSKTVLAKLDTGNSTSASTMEVGEFEDDGKYITFKIDGKSLKYEKQSTLKAIAGEETYVRPIIIIPELILGVRKIKNTPLAIVKTRGKKKTNLLLNRDVLSKLGYVVHPNNSHILTPEIEKVKII